MLKFQNINFSYDKKILALTDVSFQTPETGLVCIVGENGSGKSTLINLVSNKAKFEGELTLNKKNIKEFKSAKLAKTFSFLPQKLSFPENISVLDVIAIGRTPYTNIWGRLSKKDKKIIDKYSQKMQISDLYEKRFSQLSGGQQQRVFLAMVLCQETPLVIFDEPTNHLDVRYQIEIFDLINEIKKHKLVIMTTHNLNMAGKYGDQFIFLKGGKLIADGGKKIITAANMKALFGVKAEIKVKNGSPVILDMELDETPITKTKKVTTKKVPTKKTAAKKAPVKKQKNKRK